MAALALAACTGQLEQRAIAPRQGQPPSEPAPERAPCTGVTPSAGERALQRWTSRELDRSVVAALGDETHAFARRLASSDELLSVKRRFFRAQTASTVWAEAAVLAAEEVSLAAAAKPGFATCTSGDETACARARIETWGRALWRRTLGPSEVDAVLASFTAARAEGTLTDGLQTALQSLLMAPDFFLFQQPADGPLTGTALAERLASALWQQQPDDALLTAAETGALDTPEGFDAEVQRLLDDPRADETFREFLSHWLAPEKVATLQEALASTTRQPDLYPRFRNAGAGDDGLAYADALEGWLQSEARLSSGTFTRLLTAPTVAVNEAVARNLSLPAPTGVELRAAEDARRVGVLGQPAVLTAFGRFESSDPVHRGVFLLRYALCNDLPPPDAAVNTTLPAAALFATTRDRFSAATTDGACAGCHGLINPLGFAFENFDGVGRFRLEEGGAPVDATAVLPTRQRDAVDGLAELAQVMATDPGVRECVARQFSSWALRRVVTEAEYCAVRAGAAGFFEGEGSLSGLVQALVKSAPLRDAALPTEAP